MAFVNIDAGYTPVVSENTFKEVLAARFDQAKIVGGRMLPGASESIYYAGQVLAQYQSGPNAGLWAAYDSANASATDGSQSPIGVLLKDADVLPDGSMSEIAVIIAGEVYADLLVVNASGVPSAGLPQAVQTAMGGKKIVWHGQNVFKF